LKRGEGGEFRAGLSLRQRIETAWKTVQGQRTLMSSENSSN